MEKRKGLSVSVFRSKYDATNGGITSQVDEIILIDDNLKGISEVENEEVYLTLVRRTIRPNEAQYIHAVPTVNGVPKLGGMFGGNYVHCSDSRISALNRYPIPVHDRFEF